jgi:hypothetical protein
MSCDCYDGWCMCLGPDDYLDAEALGAQLVAAVNARTALPARVRYSRVEGLTSRPLTPRAQSLADHLFTPDMAAAADRLMSRLENRDQDDATQDALAHEAGCDCEDCLARGDYPEDDQLDLYDDYEGEPAPEVDEDGFTESDDGEFPLPGWHLLSPAEQQAAREIFQQFLARQESGQPEAALDQDGRRPDGSFDVMASLGA